MAKSIFRHLYKSDRILFKQGEYLPKLFLKDKMRRFFKYSRVMPYSKVDYSEDGDTVKGLNTNCKLACSIYEF
jgi:hypothetical protein